MQWFDSFIWSDKPHDEVWKCVESIFPRWKHHFKGQWTRENCEQKDIVRFKQLSDFWTLWLEYNADNTLIVDREHYRHFLNLHGCCLIVPDEMPNNYLVETLSC